MTPSRILLHPFVVTVPTPLGVKPPATPFPLHHRSLQGSAVQLGKACAALFRNSNIKRLPKLLPKRLLPKLPLPKRLLPKLLPVAPGRPAGCRAAAVAARRPLLAR
eukprot:747448-Hanusia_phi.AAC.6